MKSFSEKYRVLINLIPIKKGGGQQVGFNFISHIINEKLHHDFFVVATKGSFIGNILKRQNKIDYKLIGHSLVTRLFFEKIYINQVIKRKQIQITFTVFGPPILNSYCKNFAGIAYSNLFYPEVDFWKGSYLYKLRKSIVDWYRLKQILQADGLIFENSAMERRCRKIFKYNKTIFIKPSISISSDKNSTNFLRQLRKIDSNKHNILMLSGWHPNKNIALVPEILSRLYSLNIRNVDFVLTLDPSAQHSTKLIQHAKILGVDQNIKLINKIETDDIPFLYNEVDTVLLISLLESFSNNIIEAWAYNTPLIITEAEWSRNICLEGALYVDREDPVDISQKIQMLIKNSFLSEKLVKEGKKNISMYPSPLEKVKMQLDFIFQQYEKGH